MRSLERVNIRTNERTYVRTYIRTGQTLYPLHNFVVRGDNNFMVSISIPCLPTDIYSCKSFKNNVNIMGEMIQPCLTPTGQGTVFVKPLEVLIYALTSAYIALSILTIFVLTF